MNYNGEMYIDKIKNIGQEALNNRLVSESLDPFIVGVVESYKQYLPNDTQGVVYKDIKERIVRWEWFYEDNSPNAILYKLKRMANTMLNQTLFYSSNYEINIDEFTTFCREIFRMYAFKTGDTKPIYLIYILVEAKKQSLPYILVDILPFVVSCYDYLTVNEIITPYTSANFLEEFLRKFIYIKVVKLKFNYFKNKELGLDTKGKFTASDYTRRLKIPQYFNNWNTLENMIKHPDEFSCVDRYIARNMTKHINENRYREFKNFVKDWSSLTIKEKGMLRIVNKYIPKSFDKDLVTLMFELCLELGEVKEVKRLLHENTNVKTIKDLILMGNSEYLYHLVSKLNNKTYDEVKDKLPYGMEQITYKSLVEKYFKQKKESFTFDDGYNKPRLSKQLTSQKIGYTQKELQAFSELKMWFLLTAISYGQTASKYNKKSSIDFHNIYIDWSDTNIPDNVDEWSFANSCHNTSSRSGSITHLVLRDLGWNYLKMYTEDYDEDDNFVGLKPVSRMYYYQNGFDFVHSGVYTDIDDDISIDNIATTSYGVANILLCTSHLTLIDDIKEVEGANIDEVDFTLKQEYKNMDFDWPLSVWANCSEINQYKVLGTADLISEQSLKYINLDILKLYNDILNKSYEERHIMTETLLIGENNE